MLSSRLIHWRDAQTANSSMAEASKAKMDQGSTAPKASGPSNRMAPAPDSRALLVSRGCELLATGADSGCVARAELTRGPWIVLRNYRGSRRRENRREDSRGGGWNTPAKTLRGM